MYNPEQLDVEWEGKILFHLRGPATVRAPPSVGSSHGAGKERPSSHADECSTLGFQEIKWISIACQLQGGCLLVWEETKQWRFPFKDYIACG